MARTETLEQCEREGRRRLYPRLSNTSYLVLRKRREHFERWAKDLPPSDLRVLDVGGRIQPYRPLLDGRVQQYVALDLVAAPLSDVRANAYTLPFKEAVFDLVLCTQVLEYLPDPNLALQEIYRVLKPAGTLWLSVAAFYPRATDEEHWRFLPAGLRHLLRGFRSVEIKPEGSTVSGSFRAFAVCLTMLAKFPSLQNLIAFTIVPALNLSARALEWVANTNNDQATGNYSVLARK